MNCRDGLLQCLLNVAGKAGKITRACREDDHLLSLLVEEKKESEKNPRFLHDFKTLADVLVQEVIKHDLCSKFRELEGHVYGEESNEFTNGEASIIVQVKETEKQTADLLYEVLSDVEAAATLARVIHSEEEKIEIAGCNDIDWTQLPDELALWIDPIDSTSEYIQGSDGEDAGLAKSGLPCVTVLIGVFDRSTGLPIIGVINQPFATKTNEGWTSSYFHGVNLPGMTATHPEHPMTIDEKLIAVSSSEESCIRELLIEHGYTPVELAGAGYKLLKIVTGEVLAYVLSKPTTFQWDTCAGQAILESMGGGIVDFATYSKLEYRAGRGVKQCCNEGGVLAYRNLEIKNHLIQILRQAK